MAITLEEMSDVLKKHDVFEEINYYRWRHEFPPSYSKSGRQPKLFFAGKFLYVYFKANYQEKVCSEIKVESVSSHPDCDALPLYEHVGRRIAEQRGMRFVIENDIWRFQSLVKYDGEKGELEDACRNVKEAQLYLNGIVDNFIRERVDAVLDMYGKKED